MSLHFDAPEFLWLGVLAAPLLLLGWRALSNADMLRRVTILTLRTILLLAIVTMLAGPNLLQDHDRVTVIGLLDVSGSVKRFADLPPLRDLDQAERQDYIRHLRAWFRRATGSRNADDRFGLVVFDGEAIAITAPTTGEYFDDQLDVSMAEGTSIADAIRLGLAMFPADTARRLVLVSDGNQTVGDALEAAREAAAGGAGGQHRQPVPIDVLPISYNVPGDVQIVRVEAPPNAQPGQKVTIRIITEATQPATGRLSLRREGAPVDLNGDAPGTVRRVDLPEDESVHLATVTLGETPVNRFEAVIQVDDPALDALVENDRAEAFTATPGKGRVLILDPDLEQRPNALAELLRAARIPVAVRTPAQLPTDLLALQNDDLIVLDNVPAFEFNRRQQELIARYVNDLGGGLIMIGGENSFGAGGWNGTPVEEVLPLELDPPKELRLPQAALVLVLDRSGSMQRPVAGARATQQEVANEAAATAIESLRAESLIGVVTFNEFADEYVPMQYNEDPEAITKRVRAIHAGGGTNLEPALLTAFRMLRDVEAERKRVVLLTDGQSPRRNLETITTRMVDADIRISTIAVGDDADDEMLARLAELGKGEFYRVYNARLLPRVLVDSVQIINKPLIKEVAFVPVVRPTGSSLTIGMSQAPPLGGLVVTAPRDDPTAVIEMTHPDGEPLLAHWQVGLGRAAAFTSDYGGPWSDLWLDWPTAAGFWTQLVRTTSRPAVSSDAELITSMEDGRLNLILEAADDEEGFLDYLQVDGRVYRPDGTSVPVRLRQTAPGRYEASVPARAAGNYIVALNPRRGDRQLAPVIGGASRTTGDEFRRYQSNLQLLDRIVDLTGGRRLDPADPGAVNLFDRADMPRSISLLPAWRDVLWLVVALLLLDIAGRRVAWNAAAIRRFAAQAVAKVTPSRVRGAEVAATLASLRTATSRFEQQVETQSQRVDQFEKPAEVKPMTREERQARLAAMPKPEPEPSRVKAAIQSLLGRRGSDEEEPEQPEAPAEAKTDEQREPSSETTSSLLAAKRRARERLGRAE